MVNHSMELWKRSLLGIPEKNGLLAENRFGACRLRVLRYETQEVQR